MLVVAIGPTFFRISKAVSSLGILKPIVSKPQVTDGDVLADFLNMIVIEMILMNLS